MQYTHGNGQSYPEPHKETFENYINVTEAIYCLIKNYDFFKTPATEMILDHNQRGQLLVQNNCTSKHVVSLNMQDPYEKVHSGTIYESSLYYYISDS